MDDSARTRDTPLTFAVYGDGRLLARSKPLPFGTAPFRLEANISGMKIVELVARGRNGERYPAVATWGEAVMDK
jgi:hypothetical protein